MAVLHLSEPSGPLRTLGPRLERLATTMDVEVVLPGPGAATAAVGGFATVRTLRYEVLTFPSRPIQAVRALARLGAEVRRFRTAMRASDPDLVIVATTLLPAVVAAARAERIPVVVDGSELLVTGSDRLSPRTLVKRALLAATVRTADAVVACSAAAARQFRSGARARITTIHPGIDPDAGGGDGAGFRASHGLATNDFVVLSVGSITAGRGQDVLLRALPRIRAAVPDARCVIAGVPHPRAVDRAYADDLHSLADRPGIAGHVRFAGTVERIEDAYAAADVVVNPAAFAREAFGRVAFEALVAGRPVVSTTDGAVGELLRDEHDALLVAPGSPEAIANAVIRIAGDPGLADRLVAEGGRRTRVDFRQDACAEQYAAVIDAVLRD